MLPPSQLLPIIQSLQEFEWPRPKIRYPEGRDESRYYEFHKDAKHQTNDYYRLQRLINFMVNRGHLREYIEEEVSNSCRPLSPKNTQLVIDKILDGPISPRTRAQPHSV